MRLIMVSDANGREKKQKQEELVGMAFVIDEDA